MIGVYITPDGLAEQNITSRVIRFSVRRGKPSEIAHVQPGVATIEALNADRALDPDYGGSPWAGRIRPGILVRITVLAGSTYYNVFVGYVEQIVLRREQYGRMICAITAVDNLAQLSRINVSLSRPAESTGARIWAILNAALPGAPRSIAAGKSVMAAEAINSDALSACRAAAETEGSYLFYVNRDGTITFLDRHALLKPPLDTPVDLPDPGGIDVRYDVDRVYNSIRVRYEGGETLVENASSISQYGKRSMDIRIRTTSAHEADSAGRWLLLIFSKVKARVDGVEYVLNALPDAQKATLATLDIGRRVRLPLPGLGPSTLEALVERLAWRFDGTLKVAIGLGNSWPSTFWVIEKSRIGVDNFIAY